VIVTPKSLAGSAVTVASQQNNKNREGHFRRTGRSNCTLIDASLGRSFQAGLRRPAHGLVVLDSSISLIHLNCNFFLTRAPLIAHVLETTVQQYQTDHDLRNNALTFIRIESSQRAR